MNTSVQHPSRLPSTPQEGNLSVSQTPFTPSSEALRIKETVDGIAEKVGTAIEKMKKKKGEFLVEEMIRKMEEEYQIEIEKIALAFEKTGKDAFISFGQDIRKTGDVNAKSQDGYYPLYWVVLEGHTEITKLLLARPEIKVNVKINSERYTPLMRASKYGHTEITKLLLARPEIQVNEVDNYRGTALIEAVGYKHIEIIKLLLAHPSMDLMAHNQGKRSLHVYASTPEIRSLIEEAMRKQGIPF